MSLLFDKSNQNLQASLKLYDTCKWFAPSIHCAYYSCVQLMIHIIMEVGNKKYSDVEQEINSWIKNRYNKGGSHFYYIDTVQKLLMAAGKSNSINKFSRIKQLKNFREDSDYKPVEITYDMSKEAYDLSESITNLLKMEFNL